MCGAHAQVLSAAELSVGLRVEGATREDVRKALWEERSLIKAHGPRGTVHLLATKDLPMWSAALGSIPGTPNLHAPDVRLTPEQFDDTVNALRVILEGAELTVEELDDAVVAATGPWAGERVMPAFQDFWPRWRQAIGAAGQRGVLCFGPNRGRKVTYTSPLRWLPGFEPHGDPAEAAGELLERYLYAYGPATSQQYAKWLAAPQGWVAKLFAANEHRLEAVEFGGATAWVVKGDAEPAETEPEGVRLLPYFDAYQVGCHPRELLFPGRAMERATARGQAGNYPVLLVDGTVAGVWHQRRSGRRLYVAVEPFGRLARRQQEGLEQQVEQVGEVLQGTPELVIGPVTVGPHA